MPTFNPWVGRTDMFGQRLEVMRHHPKEYARQRTREFAGELGSAVGSVVGYGASRGVQYMTDKLGNYYRGYSVTKPKRKKRFSNKKQCCRYIKGKKYCSPEFCEKRRRKFYYY